MFLYPENGINWYSGDASGGVNGIGGTSALIGLNKGDGVVYEAVNVSYTPQVLNVSMYANVEDDPPPAGFYMWNVNNVTKGVACDENSK